MSNKKACVEMSEKVIALLAEADSLMTNASVEFDSKTNDPIEYEYFIQKQLFHGSVKSALLANSKLQSYGDVVSYVPLRIE